MQILSAGMNMNVSPDGNKVWRYKMDVGSFLAGTKNEKKIKK